MQTTDKMIKVRLEDVGLIMYEADGTPYEMSSMVGVYEDGFEDRDFDALFNCYLDEKCYRWFSESEYRDILNKLSNAFLYPLDDGEFIAELSDSGILMNIKLREVA